LSRKVPGVANIVDRYTSHPRDFPLNEKVLPRGMLGKLGGM